MSDRPRTGRPEIAVRALRAADVPAATHRRIDLLHDRLDIEREVAAAAEQSLGDTVLLGNPGRLDGLPSAIAARAPRSAGPARTGPAGNGVRSLRLRRRLRRRLR